MPIETVIEILKAYGRYVDYMNDHGSDDVIELIKDNTDSLLITMRGHCGETYELEVWTAADGQLHIENPLDHTSVFDIIDMEEYELTKAKLHYIIYGEESIAEAIPDEYNQCFGGFNSEATCETCSYAKRCQQTTGELDNERKVVYKTSSVKVIEVAKNEYEVLALTVSNQDGIANKDWNIVGYYTNSYCRDNLGRVYSRFYNPENKTDFAYNAAIKCAKDYDART